jgi:hypothetical protein
MCSVQFLSVTSFMKNGMKSTKRGKFRRNHTQVCTASQLTRPQSQVCTASQSTRPQSQVCTASQPTRPQSQVCTASQPTRPQSQFCTASQPTRPQSKSSLPWKAQTSREIYFLILGRLEGICSYSQLSAEKNIYGHERGSREVHSTV